MEYYVHQVPGRLRIKIPVMKRNPYRAKELQDLLRCVTGITSTSVNTVTGSVTINYDVDVVRPAGILNLLAEEDYIDVSKAISGSKYVETALSNAGKAVSKILLTAMLDRALKGSSLSFITVFI
jgi:hypothetical protein